jgi:hypothetical protein
MERFTAALDPNQSLQRNHFRWVINFVGGEVPHGPFTKLIGKSEGRVPVTVVRIPYALLYTHRVTEDNVIVSPTDTSEDGDVLGRSNEEVGGVIFAHERGAVSCVDESGALKIFRLEHTPEVSYEIAITNMDVVKAERLAPDEERHSKGSTAIPDPTGIYVPGDFDRYYQVIKVRDDDRTKFKLFAPKRDEVFRAKDGDCHLVAANADGLYTLTDLIR